MKKEAILHIPLSQYAYALDERTLVIRLRAAREDIRECVLYYGDRVDPKSEIRMYRVAMELIASDDLFDYFECRIKDRYSRVCYYFELSDGTETAYYYERDFTAEITCNRTEFFQFPYIRREDIVDIPDWAKDIVMYHIFPDSFASGRRYLEKTGKRIQVPLEAMEKRNDFEKTERVTYSLSNLGGTLCGVMDNLDYLSDLGINCIYLNPIFLANSYHKYDTIDYLMVDPCFGTLESLKSLVTACHKRDMHVLLDGVFNHCGSYFFAFQDVLAKGDGSRYYDWFYDMPKEVKYADPPNYEAFAYVKEMPKLNTSNPKLEEYLIHVGEYWIKEVGIDGWRLDVANEINHDFWRKFKAHIRRVKPDAFFIGEIWEDAGEWLKGDQFDSTMNYRFSYLCKDFFANRTLTPSQFDRQIQKMIMRYPEPVSLVQMNFLDSHDIPRFLSECHGDRRRMELAFFYLFMSCGIPSVFYGDEYYIEGSGEAEYRQAMPWGKEENACGKFKEWIGLRKNHSALRNGRYITKYCDDAKGIYCFERKNEMETVTITLNNSDCDVEVEGKVLPALSGVVESREVHKCKE